MSDVRERQRRELWEAFGNRDKDKVVTLLKNTEKPAEIRYRNNWTLLHYAARHNMTDVCQLLVEQYQVDPHVESISGLTALYWACYNNDTDTVKYLVSHAHCDPLIEDDNGDTPLSVSRRKTRHFLQDIIDQSKKEGFASVPDYTKAIQAIVSQERQSVLDETMAEGGDEDSRNNRSSQLSNCDANQQPKLGGVLREGQAIGCDKKQAKESVHVPSSDVMDKKDDLKDLSPHDVFNSPAPEIMERISTDIKSGQLVLDDVFDLLRGRAYDWYSIGRVLKVPFGFREGLQNESNRANLNENKLERVLHKWAESKCSPVSWDTVLKVIKDLKYNELLGLEDILKK